LPSGLRKFGQGVLALTLCRLRVPFLRSPHY
jgi:hypothetical protein